jgi:hypothetical protein
VGNLTLNIYYMEKKDKLIYELIFSEKCDFKIDVGEYITDLYQYDLFVEEVKGILRKSKVTIMNNSIDVNSNTVMWKLKVKK